MPMELIQLQERLETNSWPNLWFACGWAAFHENDGDHENDEEKSDRHKHCQGA